MGNLQSTLTVKLIDDASGPAGKIAAALKQADTQVKALAASGVSNRLGQQLTRLGASAADIEKVGSAWKNYAASQKLAASSADWTRAQTAQVRTWESATVASIRNVTRAEQALARQQQQLAARAAHAVPAREGSIGGGIAATASAYGAQRFGRKAITSAAEFDIGVRKQREFVDIPKDVQDRVLIPQAKRIGQDTQFTNLDVVKAQTKAMQGLPAGYAPSLRAEVGAGIVESVKNYALVMEADLQTSAEAIRTFLQTTSKDISTKEKALAEATRATNLMVKMAKLGGMNDEDVQQFMKFGAATGTAAGLSDTTLAALGAVGRRGGLRGDELGVFVRSASSKLVAPTSKGLDALTAAGIDFNKYTKMPGGLSVANLEGLNKRRFGKSFSADQRERLADILENGEIVGNREEFTKQVSEIIAESFDKKKNGKTKAQDAQKIAKEVGDFHKLSMESVDSEGLLNAIMTNPKMTIALLNSIFTDKHGGKGSIISKMWGEFLANKSELERVSGDPDFAKRKADEIMGGLGGSLERAKGSVENFQLAIGQANEALAKLSLDKFGNILDAISNLPEPVRRLGTEVTAVAAAIAGLKGLEALYGGFGLKGSAAALDGSAALLNAAATRLGATPGAGLPGTSPGGTPGGAGPKVVPTPGPFGFLMGLIFGKEALDYSFNNLLPKRTYPKGYDPAAETAKPFYERAFELYERTKTPVKTDYTFGSQGTFRKLPTATPGGGFNSFDDETTKSFGRTPLGIDKSAEAGAAGQKTGQAFTVNLESELQKALGIATSIAGQIKGVLSFSATPTVAPKVIGAPGKQSSVDGVSRSLGGRVDTAMAGNFMDNEYA